MPDTDRSALSALEKINEATLGRMYKQSFKLLREAWDNPLEIGPDSRICARATKHLDRLRAHATPSDGVLAAKYHRAFLAAWWAVWRARDYTTRGWHNRFGRSEFPDDLRKATVYCEGENWPPFHVPLFDRDLNLIEKVRSGSKTASYGEPKTFYAPQHFQTFCEGMIFAWQPRDPNDKYEASWSFIFDGAHAFSSTQDCCFAHNVRLDDLDVLVTSEQAVDFDWDNCERTAFFGPVERKRPIDNLESNRFESGLAISDTHVNVSEFPTSIETGPYLKLTAASQVTCLTFQHSPGLKKIELNKLGTGEIVFDRIEKASIHVSGKEASRSGDESRPSLEFIQCRVQSCKLTDLSAEEVSFCDCEIESVLLMQACHSIGSVHLDGVRQTVPSNRPQTARGMRRLRTRRPASGKLEDELGIVLNGLTTSQVTFRDVRIAGDAYFVRVEARDWIELSDVEIEGHTDFYLSAWGQLLMGDPKPDAGKGATFLGPVDFSHPITPGDQRDLGEMLIYDTEFHRDAAFENVAFKRSTVFERCTFWECPRFQSSEFNLDTSFRRSEFKWLELANEIEDSDRDAWLSRTEGAFRTLAKQMDEIKAHGWKAKFHAAQLKARFMREKDEDVPFWDRTIARVYGGVSDFGGSFTAPASYWILHLLAFWYLHWTSILMLSVFSGSEGLIAHPETVMMMVLTLALRPFFALSPSLSRPVETPCGYETTCQTSGELMSFLAREHEILFKSIGIMQSVISAVLLFLFLLAIRRKFQLS